MSAPDPDLTFREFQPGDESDFRRLNEEWIVRHFALEPKDEEALADPQRTILQPGGRIFFAVRQGRPIGCCALVPVTHGPMTHGPTADGATRSGEFEVAKMAVTESARGAGIGRALLEKVIAEARLSGARRLFLETNSKLVPAIRLYESVGFRHIPAGRIVPSPYARSNVSMELQLS